MIASSVKTIRLLIVSSLCAFCLIGYAQTETFAPKASTTPEYFKGDLSTIKPLSEKDYIQETSRGATYCVINIIQYGFFEVKIDSYSSRKLSSCNKSAYHRLTEASITAQTRTFLSARQVVKGGFHTLVASRDLNPFIHPYIFLGEIRMQKHATVEVDYLSYIYKYLSNSKFRRGLENSNYVPLDGNSPMQYLYNPGEQVHELVSPEGRVFTMTSFTDYINPSLTLENLKDMGSSLTLPTGWKYRTRIIDKQIVIRTTAPAYLFVGLFDEFSNYYVETK